MSSGRLMGLESDSLKGIIPESSSVRSVDSEFGVDVESEDFFKNSSTSSMEIPNRFEILS